MGKRILHSCAKFTARTPTNKDVTRTLIGGGDMFIYSCFARQISFQVEKFEFDLKRSRRAENEYMNIPPPPPISRSARCIPIRLLVTTFNNSNNLLELSFHAYEINPDPNPYPNPNNPNNLYIGYNNLIGIQRSDGVPQLTF